MLKNISEVYIKPTLSGHINRYLHAITIEKVMKRGFKFPTKAIRQ